MTTQSEFLRGIERFLEERKGEGWTASGLGKAALNDPNFVFDLREGRSPSLSVVERVNAFLAKQATPPPPETHNKGEAA